MSRAEFSKEKEEAAQKIESGEWEVKKKTGKVTSPGWQKFGEVYDRSSNHYAGFVRCFQCGLLKVFQRGGSPKWLAKHTCAASPTKFVESSHKENFKEACVELAAGDLRPFATFSGPHFKKLIQVAINAGAECGKFDASEIISDATTISRCVSARADKARVYALSILRDEIDHGRVCASTDLWTDNYVKRHYITLNVHFINKNWELKSFVLFTKKFPAPEETAENILQCLQESMKELKVAPEMLKKMVFVTDGGSNLVKHFLWVKYNDCTAQLIA